MKSKKTLVADKTTLSSSALNESSFLSAQRFLAREAEPTFAKQSLAARSATGFEFLVFS